MNDLEVFDLNGSTQRALVRGPDDAPVLLLVQAGPGFPLIHEAQALERALGLEQRFRVVYWDQRGTGRSFDPADETPLTIEQGAADLRAMIAALCARLRVDAVDVAGFSLGGTLALLASRECPQLRRVIAVGPDLDLPESERYAWAFAKDEALRRGHRRALRELEHLGPPPHDTPERFMTRVKWVTNFGGILTGASFLRLFLTLLGRLLTSPHYTLAQAIAALRGMQRTQARALGSLRGFSIWERVTEVPVPVTIIQGRLDAAAPPELAERFVDGLHAPAGKRLIWVDRAAHTPQFEAPGEFSQALLSALET